MLREKIRNEVMIFDGGMGTQLQQAGMKAGEIPEVYNIEHPEIVIDIHSRYLKAGANFITTNTFGCNPLKMADSGYCYCDLLKSAVNNAKKARDAVNKNAYIVLDIGPIGQMLKPLGNLTFDEAYEIIASQVLMVKDDVDAVLLETMSDLYEVKAGILAVKENSDLPVFVTMTFEQNGRTLTGCDPITYVNVVEGLGVDALGVNCSLGPVELKPIVDALLENASVPIIVQPNAGLPKLKNGKTVYELDPQVYADALNEMIKEGVSIVGGCCGTTPEYIKTLSSTITKEKQERSVEKKTRTSSQNKTVTIDGDVIVCGERLNPTGKKKIKEALLNENYDAYILEAIMQQEAGAHILDVNVGVANIDEVKTLEKVIPLIQEVINLPLQLDSSNALALEKACRYYNGKPIINSVNGKDEVLDAILPIVKKYGGVVIGLTLEEGIPLTAKERLEIARKIVNRAKDYGIDKHDVIIDCLTLTASTQQKEVNETLKALTMIKEELGVRTVLGVSNISFGLPNRPLLNRTFLTLAMHSGLDLAIINPLDKDLMDAIDAYRVLANIDKDSKDYISKQANAVNVQKTSSHMSLEDMIIHGVKEETKLKTKELLKDNDGLSIINSMIIPALDKVGKDFETNKVYLPQLIQSAESAKMAFEVIKETFVNTSSSKGTVMICTVEGDIHDIGKNIVKVILESYGYQVIDLGKDVKVSDVVEGYKKYNPDAIGLSALMTTTVINMEKTIKALKDAGCIKPIWVGGAVLSEDVANHIGASYYCKDAMASVNLLNDILGDKHD